jgi:hypothetical protein
MTATPVILAVVLVVLLAGTPACAYGSVSIHEYSQATSESTARAGGSVTVTSSTTGGGSSGGHAEPAPVGSGGGEGSAGEPAESSSSSVSRETCQRIPASASPCYGVVSLPPPAAASPRSPRPGRRPAVNPAVIAASLSSQLVLLAGRIAASPSARVTGLTGAASWFWLEPTPVSHSLSVSLGGESVTVTARASSVQWVFGDGAQLAAGPGVPYRPGAVPPGAILHTYKTRCLPGDQGHDPNVLSSCGPNGYRVQALVQWEIGYTASGPVAGGGELPARSTATSTVYPVSEARAFLTAVGGAR